MTCVGHAVTQRWHAVQRDEKRLRLPAPGGATGRCLFSSYLESDTPVLFESLRNAPTGRRSAPSIARRPSTTGDAEASLFQAISHFIAMEGQASRQLKHPTQAEKSIRFAAASIHSALHTISQRPQSLQVE